MLSGMGHLQVLLDIKLANSFWSFVMAIKDSVSSLASDLEFAHQNNNISFVSS